MLKLIAIGAGLDIRTEFPRVLELAAQIAGLDTEDDFGGPTKPAPRERPPAPDIEPVEKRLEVARRRAKWVWERLGQPRLEGGRSVADMYLGSERGLMVELLRTREDIRETPLRVTREQTKSPSGDLEKLARMFAVPGLALAVRSPIDGALTDIRIRRFQPQGDQPKIVGMLGGVTTSGAVEGRDRGLLGCYGFPHDLTRDLVVVVEGALDYLTALTIWPDADVLGAVEAGSLSLVALHAAKHLATRGDVARILIVEHADGFGKAGDRAVNEDINCATKRAVRVLGPRAVEWVFCGGVARNGSQLKDLNDMHRTHTDIRAIPWPELGDGVAA